MRRYDGNTDLIFLIMIARITSPETTSATPMIPITTPIMRGDKLPPDASDSEPIFLAKYGTWLKLSKRH